MINQLIQVVTPIFVIIAVGYIWSLKDQKFDIDFVTSISINLGTPCLAFSTLTSLQIQYFMLGVISFSTMIGIALFGVIGLCILKVSKLPVKGYLPPLMFANIGNMGLPVCLFAYGNEGVALAIVVFAVFMVGQFTIALYLYSGSVSAASLFKNPIVVSVIVSVLILISGVKPPEWIMKVSRLLGEITIPLMLLTLGVSLRRMKVFNIGRAVLLSFLRIGMGFGAGLLVAKLMGLTGTARGVFVLQNSMPVAVFNYLLAERYKRNAAETAELIIVSTVLSIFTLPLVLSFLKG